MPIIMLTARDDIRDRVAGLDAGADDYLVKPFAEEELMARIRAVLRRANKGGDRLRAGSLLVDVRAREAHCHGRRLALTPKEFDLLALLVRHPGQVLDRELLIERVWGWDYEGDVRTVDTHIKALRAKLEEAGCSRQLIETVRSVGYRFVDQHARPGGDHP